MQFPSGIEIDRVDEEVGMDVLTVCVGADQNFVSLIVLGQLQRGRVSGDGSTASPFGKLCTM